MFRSLNEIEHTARKAARGRGLPWGIADETGKAVRCLHQLKWDGIVQLIQVLDRQDVESVSLRLPEYRCGIWKSKSGKLNPLLAGPSLCDFMDSRVSLRVEIENVVCPLLLAGFLANAISGYGNAVRLSWSNVSLEIFFNQIEIHGNQEDLDSGLEHHVVCEQIACMDRPPASVQASQVWVDDASWVRLENYAKLTHVEATDASRNTGAGAGLLDND